MAANVTFLDLPQHIRLKIYRLCHVVRICPIDLGRESTPTGRICLLPFRLEFPDVGAQTSVHRFNAVGECWSRSGRLGLQHPPLPVQLLRVSRVVHDEIILLLYSENIFKINLHEASGRHYLRRLSRQALRSIRCFHIIFTLGDWRIRLDQGNPRHCLLIEKLQALVRLLKRSITPSMVKLSFNVNAVNTKTAEKVALSLRELPKLKDCAMRFGPSSNLQYTGITAANVMDISGTIPAQSFPFDRLPKEVRLLGFSYTTGLVAQSNDTTLYRGTISFLVDDLPSRPKIKCCGNCIEVGGDCCCPDRGAVFSKECVCVRIPSPLFFVSKQMRDESTRVLYSQNRFRFTGHLEEILEKLDQIPALGLGQIRRLELSIFGSISTPNGDEQLWKSFVDFIKEKMDPSKLCLTIDSRKMKNEIGGISPAAPDSYGFMRKSLKRLRGLRRLHIWLKKALSMSQFWRKGSWARTITL